MEFASAPAPNNNTISIQLYHPGKNHACGWGEETTVTVIVDPNKSISQIYDLAEKEFGINHQFDFDAWYDDQLLTGLKTISDYNLKDNSLVTIFYSNI